MFDPDSEVRAARRRSLLNYRQGQIADSLAEREAAAAASDMTEKFEAAYHQDSNQQGKPGLAGRIRASMSRADTSAESGTNATEGWDENPAELHIEDRPLIDPAILISTIWRFRLFIVFTTIMGAAAGVMIALSTPHLYEATSQFVLDPRELRLTDTELLPQSFSTEGTLALVDSQVAIIDSRPVLQAVVDNLNLADDPEFNGTASGGVFDAIGVLRDLLTGSGEGGSNRNYLAVQNLSRAVNASRGQRTFIVYVSAETERPSKSARIANAVVSEYIKIQRKAQSDLFERTSQSLNTQLDALRQDVEDAERRVEQYRAENDLVNAGGSLISDTQLLELNQQLAQVRAQKVEIQVRAETVRQLNVDAILSGTAPEILQSSTIGELRAEYATAKRSFDALATSLGPRHPSRIAAEQALATARAEISNELRRIVEATQTELRRIIQSEQQLTSELAVLKTRQVSTSTDLVRLRELEREAAATTEIYQSFLKRARETGEQQDLNTSNIRIISEASAPLLPSGPSRKIIAIVSTIMGFMAGFGLAGIFGVIKSFRENGGQRYFEDQPAPATAQPDYGSDYSGQAEDQYRPTRYDDHSYGGYDYADRHRSHDEHGYDDETSEFAPGYQEQQGEAEDIRAEINQMRDTVERLYRARRMARSEARRTAY